MIEVVRRPGIVPPSALGGGDYWSRVARVVLTGTGVNLDAVTVSTMLAAGPFGETDMLPRLLASLPCVVGYLAPVAREARIGLTPDGWTVGLSSATPEDLAEALQGAPGRAFRWAEGVGALLADPTSYRAQGAFYGRRCERLLTPELRIGLAWPSRDLPQRAAMRRAGAVAAVAMQVSTRAALALVRVAGPDASAMLRVCDTPGPWEVIAPRVARVRRALERESWE